jgi:hypothetical protein
MFYLHIYYLFIIFINIFFDNLNNECQFGKNKKNQFIKNFISRETRSIPGNEYIHSDQITQQIGDLIINLVEILPVNIFLSKKKFSLIF